MNPSGSPAPLRLHGPEPHPDEFFYSVIARWAHRERISRLRERAFQRRLFGRVRVEADIRNASHLAVLASHTDHNPAYKLEHLIDRNTVVPLLAPFLSDTAWTRLQQSLQAGGGPIRWTFGPRGPNTPATIGELRFCLDCMQADRLTWGEAFWHRVHQAPGVLFCPIHNFPLRKLGRSAPPQTYLPLEFADIDASEMASAIHSDHTARVLQCIAQEVQWLLDHPQPSRRVQLASVYDQLLRQRGWRSPGGRLHPQFRLRFVADSSEEVLRLVGWDVMRAAPLVYLYPASAKRGQDSAHPLRHLLLLRFLGLTVREALTLGMSLADTNPVNAAPQWPCLNPSAAHGGLLLIPGFRWSGWGDARIFTCPECGFSYKRGGADIRPDDIYRFTRIVTYGPIFEHEFAKLWTDLDVSRTTIKEKLQIGDVAQNLLANRLGLPARPSRAARRPDAAVLKPLWQNPTMTLRDIAGILQCKPETVQRWATSLGFPQRTKRLPTADQVRAYRREWQALRRAHPKWGRSQMFKQPVGRWLRRHDRDWVDRHLPPIKRERRRVDHTSQDRAYANQVANIAQVLLSAPGKPIRVCRVSICRALGAPTLAKTDRIALFPQTNAQILKHQETRLQFAIRRIPWFISKKLEEGKSINRSTIRASIGDDPQITRHPDFVAALDVALAEARS